MLQLIDKSKTHLIQKVSHKGRTICYQTAPINNNGKPNLNTYVIKTFGTLTEARQEAGKSINHPIKITTKKEDYPEQRSGFKKTSK